MSMLLFDLEGNPQNWPATDRGWQFGDGVFRTLYAENGHVRDLVGQVAHLIHDAKLLGLRPLPAVDVLSEATVNAIGSTGKYRLKWVVTAGDSAGGYLRAGPARTMLALAPLPDDYQPPASISSWVCQTTLRGGGGAWNAAKHLNRLEQVMARGERDPHDFAEGVICDVQGNVATGISSNLFWVDREQKLHTHPLDDGGVQGRTRSRILALVEEQGDPVRFSRWQPEYFKQHAVEAFFCNSLWGCVPLAKLDDWEPEQAVVCADYNRGLGFI